jgi:hypothetical protein
MKVKENKSEKIRDYLKSVKPSERSPKAVSEALKAKGTIVTPTLVSLVKMKMNGKQKKARKPARVAQSSRKAASRNNFGWANDVIRAKDFISSTGGIKEAKKLLDVVAHLIS